jgi:uncharacterized protein
MYSTPEIGMIFCLGVPKEKFVSLFQDDLISLVLFGSQARGDATSDSDIDILVVLKEKQQRDSKREEVIDFITDL